MKRCASRATAGSATRTWSPTSGGWRRPRAREAGPGRRRRFVAAARRPDAQRTPQPPDGAGRGHRLRRAAGRTPAHAGEDARAPVADGRRRREDARRRRLDSEGPAAARAGGADPAVDRIFVDPGIKRLACAGPTARRRRGKAGCARGGPTTITSTCGSSARPTARCALPRSAARRRLRRVAGVVVQRGRRGDAHQEGEAGRGDGARAAARVHRGDAGEVRRRSRRPQVEHQRARALLSCAYDSAASARCAPPGAPTMAPTTAINAPTAPLSMVAPMIPNMIARDGAAERRGHRMLPDLRQPAALPF